MISKNDTKNNSYEEAYKSVKREKEELEKKNNSYQIYLQNILKDKEFKDNKLGETLSEVDYLKKLLEEKERQIKEISIQQNTHKKINDYLYENNVIGIIVYLKILIFIKSY